MSLVLGMAMPAHAGSLSSHERERDLNRARFTQLLRERRTREAAPFVIYFRDSLEPALSAQFYLFTCQPAAAQTEIAKIRDPLQRQAFEAALAALVSVIREPSEHDAAPGLSGVKKPAPLTAKSFVRIPLTDGEVWRDEWDEIAAGDHECDAMPVVREDLARGQYLLWAKELFAALPDRVFLEDFSMVALALDVGMTPPHPRELLERYHDREADPYYRRLRSLISPAASASAVSVGSVHHAEIRLTSFSVKNSKMQPRPVEIPLLIGLSGVGASEVAAK